MSVSALSGDLTASIAQYATAQATQNAQVATSIAVLKDAMDAQAAVLSLISQSLGVGQTIDVQV